MKIIPLEKAIAARGYFADRDVRWACAIDDLIQHEAIDTDQLTVTKLRPMSEAPKYLFILAAQNGSNSLERVFAIENGLVSYAGTTVPENEFQGWIPMPIYKPE